jgi:hypothetical protein
MQSKIRDKENFEGVWVPRSLIKKAGATLAMKLSAFYLGVFTLSNDDKNKSVRLGLLSEKKLTTNEIVNILKRKVKQQIHIDASRIYPCEWCKSSTVILHRHHFPIPKHKGGKLTVSICPNCHCEFHILQNMTLFTLNSPYSTEIDDYFTNKGGENHVC